jgi:hypothetical protein
MFRWIAVMAAVALAIGAAYAQSSSPSQVQPTLPLAQSQMMGSPMMNSGMMGSSMMDPSMMSMMQMMQMMQMKGSGMGPGTMGQDMVGPMMCRAQMGMMGTAGTVASYLEARLAFAKSELAIDPAQEADWQRFAAALRGQAQPMSARMSGMQHAMETDSDFPTKFDARVAMLEGQVSSLKAIRDAAVGLYGRLSAAQKHGADTLLPMSLCL